MTTTFRLILCATVAAAVATIPGRAAAPVSGHVLVLDSERTVEGDIERVGEQYRIRRSAGETWIPANKVLRLCADIEDAYRFLSARANRDDADECLRLAVWSHTHGLRTHALECATAAVKLNPTHAEARRLLSGLQRAATAPPPPAVPHAVPVEAAVEVPELNTEARASFANKIEPILMNACANCHASNHGGELKLTRGYNVSSSNRLSLQQNLAAVLAQVNVQQPQDSKLLIKAITAHDPLTQQAPLNRTQMAAYRSLEDWVQTTLANNPHLREHAPSPAPAAPVEPKPAVTKPVATKVEPRPTPTSSPVKPIEAKKPEPAPATFAAGRPTPPPAAPTAPVDEFDPLLFNRQGQAPPPKEDDDKP